MAKKTKNTNQDQQVSPPSSEAFIQRNASDVVPSQSSASKRLVLKFDEGGQIAWDRLTDEQKAEFGKSVANDPTALELIGLAASNGEAIEGASTESAPSPDGLPLEIFQIDKEDVKDILLALNWVSKFSLKFAMKRFNGMDIKPEILKQAFQYDPDDLERLCVKGEKVANKYAPEWFKKYFDEITFFMLFGRCLSDQCKNAIMLQAMENMKMAQARPKPNGQDHATNKTDAIPMINKEEKAA